MKLLILQANEQLHLKSPIFRGRVQSFSAILSNLLRPRSTQSNHKFRPTGFWENHGWQSVA